MSEYLLQEDDRAPDAYESFIKKLKEKFGLNINDFFSLGTFVESDELTREYHYNTFILIYQGDDPFWKLKKK